MTRLTYLRCTKVWEANELDLLVTGAALWFGNARHNFGSVLATTGPGDIAAGTAGCWTTHTYYSLE